MFNLDYLFARTRLELEVEIHVLSSIQIWTRPKYGNICHLLSIDLETEGLKFVLLN